MLRVVKTFKYKAMLSYLPQRISRHSETFNAPLALLRA